MDEKKPLRKGSNTTVVKVNKHVKDNEPDPFYNVYHKRKIPGLDFWDVVGVAITGD